MFQGPFDHSIIKHAQQKGLVEIEFINIRDFGIGKHKMVDDTPYGGGIGMVMRVDILHEALNFAKSHDTSDTRGTRKTILLTASGKPYTQTTAQEYARLDHLIIICGHYEGIDDRIKHYIDAEVSVGDFVLTGGEIPAMAITDSVIRLLPGVLPEGATVDESFSILHHDDTETKLLEYPHFTKPQEYDTHTVPEILLKGDHKKIAQWRLEQAIEKTKKIRPDLLKNKL